MAPDRVVMLVCVCVCVCVCVWMCVLGLWVMSQSRVATSVLHAAGLSILVTHTLQVASHTIGPCRGSGCKPRLAVVFRYVGCADWSVLAVAIKRSFLADTCVHFRLRMVLLQEYQSVALQLTGRPWLLPQFRAHLRAVRCGVCAFSTVHTDKLPVHFESVRQ